MQISPTASLVKQTVIPDGDRPVRYLLCRDTDRAAEDARVREKILERLTQGLDGSRTAETHTRKACDLMSKPGYARYLRETEGGGLRIDRAKRDITKHDQNDYHCEGPNYAYTRTYIPPVHGARV